MEFDAKEYLSIDESMLTQELAEHSLKFEKLSHALSDCALKLEEKTQHIDIIEAEKALMLRTKAVEDNIKLTEKTIEQSLAADLQLIQLRKERQKIKHDKDIISGMVRAMEHRRDMLKSVSFNARQEGLLETKKDIIY
jgi:hypothetical protein